MEEGDSNKDKKETEMENEDAEEGEILDDDEEEETQQQQTTTTGAPGTSINAPTSTVLPPSTAFPFGNQSDKSGFGLISGLTHSSPSINASGSSSREVPSRSSSERSKKDDNRSSSKKSDSKKSNSTSNSIGTGTNSNLGPGSSRNSQTDKRKRKKFGKDEAGKDQPDKDGGGGPGKDAADENGLRPLKQRRASSREPGEAGDSGSSNDESDRTDSDDDSVDFNEEFFKGMVKQMEEMLKSGKDKGQKKNRDKLEKMMEKLKRLQSGSDTREMKEIVRQNRRLFRPSTRDRSRDRFDRFGPRGFRDRRGRGGRMRDRVIWRDRDRDRRDFRDRERDRDRDRFRDRDKMMGIDQPPPHHHHHPHHQSPSLNQSQSQSSPQTTQSTPSTITSTSTDSTSANAPSASPSSSVTPTTSASIAPPSSQNSLPVIPQHQALKENDRDREKSPKSTCKFYLDGKCHKGAECPFPHDAPPPKKKDICKFYLLGFCGKGDGCLFMHGEFPCKFYHTGAECYSGDKCRFSHEPLTDETRGLLKNYLDSGELPDEINRGDGPNHSRPKKPAILGDPTDEMKKSYFTWLWQQEMKELELAYTGTKRNLFLIDKEFAITEQPPQPDSDPHPYYRNESTDMRQGPDAGGPKILSYYLDTMSDASLKPDLNSGPVNDDKLIEMSFHDEDLRLPPSGLVPPRLPPPMGAPGPAPVDSPFPIGNPDPSSLPMTPSPFDSQSSTSTIPQSVNSNIPPSGLTTVIPSGPPPLLPMQPKLLDTYESPSSFPTPSSVNNNQSVLSTPVMPEERPLPPLKESLPPGPYQDSSSLGPPPPLYAVNSFNGPQPVVPTLDLNSSSIQSSVQSTGREQNQFGHNVSPNSNQQQFSSLSTFPDSMDPSSSMRLESGSTIPDNLPPAARHLLQRISNNQRPGANEDPNDLLFNEANIKKESNDSVLHQSSDQLTKSPDETNADMKQLLSESDDDTEDEPVKAALKNLKDAPNATPIKHESKKDKNVKNKLDIVKMLNVIRQTTLQPTPSSTDENKHADFWQNILSGTKLADNASITLSSGGRSNTGFDYSDSRSILPSAGTPPLPGTERRDPRLKRSSNESLGDSPFQDFTSSKPSEGAFKSDFEYRLHQMTAPKIDYSIYEGLFMTDVRMKTDPRLINFFKKNTLKDYNPLG